MRERWSIQQVASFAGLAFLVAGVAGFIPGLVTDFAQMRFAGRHADAQLLGLFRVSALHNAVHVLYGVSGLLLARTLDGARAFLVGGGLLYLVLWVYGLSIDLSGGANFLPFDTADNWLHLALGAGMVAAGLAAARARPAPA